MGQYSGRVTLPCGWTRTGKMKEHLAHYRACSDPFCQERLAVWENLKKLAAKPGMIVRRGFIREG